eukprot:TRINITY_DN18415_c0_g1_i1.p1 TRINITY_DN18415_c0_g1~~TRINITY_DN18415_c0_g1_i1.p1  ORF type:complete len:372 (+),score=58.82 TRINITY_DN18415_c0_g1_i1:61-1176(+)
MAEEKEEVPKSLNEQLLEACKEHETELVQKLLADGADAKYEMKIPGTWGAHKSYSSIHYALGVVGWNNKKGLNMDIVRLLLNNGADVNAQHADYDWRGCGSTTTAFEYVLRRALSSGSEEDSELLALFLKNGADANKLSRRDRHSMRTDANETYAPIHEAARAVMPHCIRALVECGAQVDARRKHRLNNEYGYREATDETALHIVCSCKVEKKQEDQVVECASFLLDHGANVNAVRSRLQQDKVPKPDWAVSDDPRDGKYHSGLETYKVTETPLHIAVRNKSARLISVLISRDANRDILWHKGDESLTVWQLCEGDKGLERAVRGKWSKETHRYHPESTRKAIFTILLIANSQKWPLPPELLYLIFDFAYC